MKIIFPLFIVLLICGCSSKDSKTDASFVLQPEDFKTKVDAGAILIDVRTVEEYANGHITGSLNMDVNAPNFKDNVLMLDKSKQYAVYCASGVRSGKAADVMRQTGFTSVYTLAGGVKTWSDKGLPLE
jgi:rhodanese-related sulfurtransferase